MPTPYRNQPIIALACCLALTLTVCGCKSPNLESARRFAYFASLSAPTTVKVKQRKPSVLVDRVKSMVGAVPKPDPRTAQILRRYGLEKLWKDDPENAIVSLSATIANQRDLESIFALANLKYVWAERLRLSGQDQNALSEYADTTVLAYQFLFAPCYDSHRNAYDPNFRGICDLYNRSLEQMLRIIDRENSLRPNYRYQIKTESGEIRFSTVVSGRWRHENIEDLRFVSDFETKGLENRYRTFGLGVPLIADWKTDQNQSPVSSYYPPGLSIPLTAFLQVKENGLDAAGSSKTLDCTLHLYDPLEQTEIRIGDRSAPLESDFSTPLALFLNDPLLNTKLLGVFSMLNADIAKQVRGLYMLEPYDPTKIPVLLVHGLASSPTTWTEMFNDLRADPRLREHYQFWFYMYPTGQPFWESAAQMRTDLQKLRQTLDPDKSARVLDEMVFVGHSMGGLVSRMQTIHSDDRFWKLVSEQSPDQLQGDVETRTELLDTFYFEPNRSIRRVVTIASPHLGSDFANNTTIWLSRSFFQISDMFNVNKGIVKQNPDYFHDKKLLSIKTSIDSLSPDSPFFKAMQQARVAPWVTYHNIYGETKQKDVISIVGNKVVGPGDGIVPVESARAIRAVSELQVNANHTGIHRDPKTIQEVKRILLQNLVETGRVLGNQGQHVVNIMEQNASTLVFDAISGCNRLVPYSTNSTNSDPPVVSPSWPNSVANRFRIQEPGSQNPLQPLEPRTGAATYFERSGQANEGFFERRLR